MLWLIKCDTEVLCKRSALHLLATYPEMSVSPFHFSEMLGFFNVSYLIILKKSECKQRIQVVAMTYVVSFSVSELICQETR